MNERIKTLCQEAFTEAHESRIGPDGLVRSDGNPYIFYEKFAKLIVAEMLQTCEEHPGWTGRMIGEQIKQHFGVEEPKGWICPKCNADRTRIACPLGFGATVDGRCPMTMEAQ